MWLRQTRRRTAEPLAKTCKDYAGFLTKLAGVHLFVAASVSVLIQALRSVAKKWTQNRPSVSMETSSHVIKVLSVCLRPLHLSVFFFFKPFL